MKPMSLIKILLIIFFVFVQSYHSDASPLNSNTIAGLKTVYLKESRAQKRYLLFSEKAKSENYPNISRLFVAISTSESIHARNMKKVLSNLGADITDLNDNKMSDLSMDEISDTKVNLGAALGAELQDIDHVYPMILEKIRPEKIEDAIKVVTYALESERQHRHIIEMMKSATENDIFFGVLAGTMENKSSRCFICMICGSTVMELPEEKCPVCGNSVSNYKEGP